ncbi:hypothetical protein KJ359_001611 [Pestalotiopsis sp. 9143b]|nr:hypothetical protein KJ359_001611 [Pestalotiopsis sp. 9143b]
MAIGSGSAFFSACGLAVYVELGMVMPRSGGEKNYLERIYRRPKYLFTCIIAMLYALFAGSPDSSLAFGSYILHAAGYADAKERYESRAVAVGCVSVAVLLHGLRPKWGLRAIKALAFFKFALLTVIICAGFAALAGKRQVPDPGNFENLFAGAGSYGLHEYAAILLRMSYAYGGASAVNNILTEFQNLKRALSVAAPLALGTVAVLYLLVNVAYFAAVPRDQFVGADVVIAGVFFRNVFGGRAAARVLSALIGFCNLGNVLAASFDASRMIQELAKEGVLPFSHLFASSKGDGAPIGALALCWTSTVVMVLAPPPGPIYNFLIDATVYPRMVLATLVACGFVYMRLNPRENWSSPLKVPLAVLVIYAAHHCLVAAMPLASSLSHNGSAMPPWLAPVIGLGILGTGVLYWVVWAKVLPRVRGYRVEARRTVGEDGSEMVEFRKVPRTIVTETREDKS